MRYKKKFHKKVWLGKFSEFLVHSICHQCHLHTVPYHITSKKFVDFGCDQEKRRITVQKEEPVRLILLMQRDNILYMTDNTDVASFLADFYVLYKFASLEYVECAGILIMLLITYSSDANLDNK
jgi:hypothetical protein